MSHITKAAWTISIFNICCCLVFFWYKYMVFEGHFRITKSGASDRHQIVKSVAFNPNFDTWKRTDYHFLFEMCGYMLGLFFNALLPLGINTAQEKNAFFFFPGYYFVSIWLSIVTMIEGFRFGLLPYIGYSVLNLMLMVVVIGLHRAILKEKRRDNMAKSSPYGWKI